MKKKLPVTIISANYNNGPFLEDYFNSILDSSVLPMQISIVDDCSTDDSIKIINSYAERFSLLGVEFDFVKFDTNQGFGYALNEAISLIKYEYALRIDPDDILHRNRIEVQYSYMLKNPSCSILGSNISYFLSGSSSILRNSTVPISESDIHKTLKSGCIPLIHGSSMLRSAVFNRITYRPETVPAEDYDLFSRASKEGFKLSNIGDVLTLVRVHAGSVSNLIPYNTIKRTFLLREEIWGIKFSTFHAKRRFYNQKFYRKYLFEKSVFKFIFFFIAALCWPESVVRNLKKRLK